MRELGLLGERLLERGARVALLGLPRAGLFDGHDLDVMMMPARGGLACRMALTARVIHLRAPWCQVLEAERNCET